MGSHENEEGGAKQGIFRGECISFGYSLSADRWQVAMICVIAFICAVLSYVLAMVELW